MKWWWKGVMVINILVWYKFWWVEDEVGVVMFVCRTEWLAARRRSWKRWGLQHGEKREFERPPSRRRIPLKKRFSYLTLSNLLCIIIFFQNDKIHIWNMYRVECFQWISPPPKFINLKYLYEIFRISKSKPKSKIPICSLKKW